MLKVKVYQWQRCLETRLNHCLICKIYRTSSPSILEVMSPELASGACNRRLEESMDEGLLPGETPVIYKPRPMPEGDGFYCSSSSTFR
jgi:hypothetical protein